MVLPTILAALDFSDVTPQVVTFAAAQARAFGSKLVLLHIAEPEPEFVGFEAGPQPVRTAVAREIRAEHQQLESYKASLVNTGLEVVALYIQGSIAAKILMEARQQGAGLIVLGSHGHGALYHLLAGSVATAVLQEAECAVTIVPARRREPAVAE